MEIARDIVDRYQIRMDDPSKLETRFNIPLDESRDSDILKKGPPGPDGAGGSGELTWYEVSQEMRIRQLKRGAKNGSGN